MSLFFPTGGGVSEGGERRGAGGGGRTRSKGVAVGEARERGDPPRGANVALGRRGVRADAVRELHGRDRLLLGRGPEAEAAAVAARDKGRVVDHGDAVDAALDVAHLAARRARRAPPLVRLDAVVLHRAVEHVADPGRDAAAEDELRLVGDLPVPDRLVAPAGGQGELAAEGRDGLDAVLVPEERLDVRERREVKHLERAVERGRVELARAEPERDGLPFRDPPGAR